MSTYLVINLIIISVPLLLTWLPRYSYYRLFKPLITSICLVGLVFIPWDMWATATGQWAFNPDHISTRSIGPIPLEEFLFFITVPYSCLFLFYAFHQKYGQIQIKRNLRSFIYALSIIFLVCAIAVYPKAYSTTICLIAAIFLFTSNVWSPQIYRLKIFWWYLALGFGLFFIFNSILTALPIVTYDPQAITNIRIGTIPIEDFFYNFTLLAAYALFFFHFGLRRTPSKT